MAAAAQLPTPPGPRLPRAVQTFFFIFGSRWFISRMARRYGPIVQLGTAARALSSVPDRLPAMCNERMRS